MPNKETSDTMRPEEPIAGIDPKSDMAALQSLGLTRLNRFGTAWMEALGEMGSEVMSFVADRIKEDVKTQQQILHCDDLAELRRIQTDFLQKAIDQYTAETGKLVEMSQHVFPGQSGGKDS